MAQNRELAYARWDGASKTIMRTIQMRQHAPLEIGKDPREGIYWYVQVLYIAQSSIGR